MNLGLIKNKELISVTIKLHVNIIFYVFTVFQKRTILDTCNNDFQPSLDMLT